MAAATEPPAPARAVAAAAPPGPARAAPVAPPPAPSTVGEPPPAVRITNMVRPPAPVAPGEVEEGTRLFPEEGPAGGCASGECLPDEEPEADTPAPARPAGRDDPRRSLDERWRAVIDTVQEKVGGRHAAALKQARLLWIKPGEVAVAYLPEHGFHRSAVTGPQQPRLLSALAEHFATPMRLVVQEASPGEAPARLSLAEQETRHREAHKSSTEGKVRSHPAVRSILQLLGGEIEHIQVYEPVRSPSTPAAESLDESA